jgi:multisubunit Na+/H+ antiporter MnhE subunit
MPGVYGRVIRFVEVASWWVLLCCLWLTTASSVSEAEMVAAVVLSVPCAVAAVGARRAVGASWRLRPGWVRCLVPLPAKAVADSCRILVMVVRQPLVAGDRGRLAEVVMTEDDDSDRAAARRALALVALSYSPGSLVVDSGDDKMTVHVLADDRAHRAIKAE